MEQWKEIPGYEGYQISTNGEVRSVDRFIETTRYKRLYKGKLIKPFISHGYKRVNLWSKNKQKGFDIQRLMGITFLNLDVNSNLVVDHIDNDRLNNSLDNLQIITARLNTSKDKDKTKTSSKYIGVSFHKASKKWRVQLRINKERLFLGNFDNEYDASIAYKNKIMSI